MRSDRLVQLVALCTLILGLGASVVLTGAVAASIGRNGLVYADTAEAGDPPEVGLGIAMGAFRGLFVNMLWYRANDAKEKGNYFEAIDLAKTITRLQPRFPRVWVFHAWNMAYNISVATQTPQERWNWVNAGIRLLRDQAIPANPNDLLIHKELAWIFLHKVQGVMDDANHYYKREFAGEWTVVLGPPPRRTEANRKREDAVRDYAAWLSKIVEAKSTLEEIYTDKDVGALAKSLVDRLKNEAGLDMRANEDRIRLLSAVEVGRSLIRRGLSPDALPGGVGQQPVFALLQDRTLEPAWRLIVPHIRKRVLVDEYHMEPDRMVTYTKKYGPLDWRHPAAHALYWSARGVDQALEKVTDQNRPDFDFLNTDRVTVQAVQELYRSGTINFDILQPEGYLAIPDADFIPTYRDILLDLVDRERSQMQAKVGADISKRPFNLYAAGYENFMRDAIVFLYRRGQKQEARDYQSQLLADYLAKRLNTNDYDVERQLNLPLDEFVVDQIKERVTTPNVAVQEVVASLVGAYVNGLLANDQELFRSQFDYARTFHAAFMKEQNLNIHFDGDRGRLANMNPDFAMSAAQVFTALMSSIGLEQASLMYNRSPQDLQIRVYDMLADTIKPEIDAQAADGHAAKFDIWFPPPAGLEDYRALKKAEKQKDAPKSETEQK